MVMNVVEKIGASQKLFHSFHTADKSFHIMVLHNVEDMR